MYWLVLVRTPVLPPQGYHQYYTKAKLDEVALIIPPTPFGTALGGRGWCRLKRDSSNGNVKNSKVKARKSTKVKVYDSQTSSEKFSKTPEGLVSSLASRHC